MAATSLTPAGGVRGTIVPPLRLPTGESHSNKEEEGGTGKSPPPIDIDLRAPDHESKPDTP